MQTITILGSTGSIGTQSLEVAKKHNIKIKALAAHSNAALLAAQARSCGAEYACIFSQDKFPELESLLSGSGIKPLCGMAGLKEIASLRGVDKLVNSVVGMVGLEPTLAAIECGTDIALANKETLVAGGELVMKKAAEGGVSILPVDSEHSAVFQCLRGNDSLSVRKIILTASGGPFFGKSKAELREVTVEQALSHPNWSMGSKITVDSATMMNKGLEFIEAMRLFSLTPEMIEIVVHRQSIVHSAVEFMDSAVIAQLGEADMRLPIQYALLYPERAEGVAKRLSLTDHGTLTFEKPDYEAFDCLRACIDAAAVGGILPACVNAANEVAVQAFLEKRISYLRIGELVQEALKYFRDKNHPADSLEAILAADREAREYTNRNITKER